MAGEDDDLRQRAEEAAATFEAIRTGEVDALVVTGADGQDRVYSLSSAERAYRLMIEAMPEGAVMLDVERRVVLYANPAFARLVGISETELLGRSIDPYFRAQRGVTFQSLFEGTGADGEAELTLAPVHGRVVPVHVTRMSIVHDFEHLQCIIVRDLTTEHESKRKDEFLAMLGHELRNPLAPMGAAVELLGEELGEGASEDAGHALQILDRQLRQMTLLVGDLLDIARITQGKIELRTRHVDAREVARAAVANVQALLEEQGRVVELDLSGEPAPIDADQGRIAQVISNLLNNAIKYSEPDDAVRLSVRKEGNRVVLAVWDEGAGIDPELLPHVFEPFRQAEATLDRASGGMGVGLAVVKRLVEMHGGTAEARSEGLGRGSEFAVRLPVARGAGPGRATHPTPSRLPSGPKRNVVVVDDNRDSALMLSMVLRRRGHDVEVAHDGQEALALIERRRPDVVLLDIGLPGMDGYALARTVREELGDRDVRLVAVTGYGQAEARERAFEAGFDAHLVKPVSPKDLLDALA